MTTLGPTTSPVSPTFRRPSFRVNLAGGDGDGEEGEEDESGRLSRGSSSGSGSGGSNSSGGGKGGKCPAPASPREPQQQQEKQQGSAADAVAPAAPSGELAMPQARASEEAEVFSHDEIVCLRLIFALFDDNGDDFVDEGELVRYAEETGACVVKSRGKGCLTV